MRKNNVIVKILSTILSMSLAISGLSLIPHYSSYALASSLAYSTYWAYGEGLYDSELVSKQLVADGTVTANGGHTYGVALMYHTSTVSDPTTLTIEFNGVTYTILNSLGTGQNYMFQLPNGTYNITQDVANNKLTITSAIDLNSYYWIGAEGKMHDAAFSELPNGTVVPEGSILGHYLTGYPAEIYFNGEFVISLGVEASQTHYYTVPKNYTLDHAVAGSTSAGKFYFVGDPDTPVLSQSDTVATQVAFEEPKTTNNKGEQIEGWAAIFEAIPTQDSNKQEAVNGKNQDLLHVDISGFNKTIPSTAVEAVADSKDRGMHVFIGDGVGVTFLNSNDNSKYIETNFSYDVEESENEKFIDFEFPGDLGTKVIFHTRIPKCNAPIEIYEIVNGDLVFIGKNASNDEGLMCFEISRLSQYILMY